jgi:hypothetical protein
MSQPTKNEPVEISANGHRLKISGLQTLMMLLTGVGLFGTGVGARSLLSTDVAQLQTQMQQNCEEIKALKAFQKEATDLLHRIDTRVAILAQRAGGGSPHP